MSEFITNAGYRLREWKERRSWSWLKKLLFVFSLLTFLTSSFLFLTPAGASLREFGAATVIMTQHRSWAWMLVGKDKRDNMVSSLQQMRVDNGEQAQDFNQIVVPERRIRNKEDLIKVEDINKPLFKGKMMWVYDPKSIRMVVTSKEQFGERITEMVQRTGAVAGVNAGGFDDPDGLGNGFAPIGMIMSNREIMYADVSSKQPIVGFNGEGKLIVGNYSLDELRDLDVKEAASFYPRVILDGKPLITSGDGGAGRDPRTAVGQKADGTVIFIVIEGRQTTTWGATLKEVQDLFLEQDVINAGFLDGGASSELVVDGQLLTKVPSKYGERRLPSAFLIFDQPEQIVVKSPWEGLSRIDPGGAKSHPEYLADIAAQREQAAKVQAENAAKAAAAAAAAAKNGSAAGTTTTGSGTAGGTGGSSGGGTGGGRATPAPTPSAGATPQATPPATESASPSPGAGTPATSPSASPTAPPATTPTATPSAGTQTPATTTAPVESAQPPATIQPTPPAGETATQASGPATASPAGASETL